MREMKPKTKRRKRVADTISSMSAAAEDRISGLPDALVCHILSFLPTISAVRTCVLSRRWRNLWESVTTLDFDTGFPRHAAKLKTFVEYVLFFRNSSNIHKFRLVWKNNRFDLSHIDGWIRTAMKRNVTELDLHVEITYRRDNFYKLPRSLFMCKTLVVLKLRTHVIVNVPASGCFPSLQILQVMCGRFYDDSLFKLFSNCPKLEYLTLDKNEIWSPNVSVVKVAAPALKTLRICSDEYEECNHSISCPKLENLVLKGCVLNKYCLGKAESLVQASIELLNHSSNKDPCFTSLLEGVSSVKFLCFSAHCFEVASLPAFDNLSKLKLVLHKCFSWELLMELLYRSPHLQHLVLEHSATGCRTRYYEYESDTKHEKGPKSQWHASELVPSCLVSHLETIAIEGFKGQLNTMEMAKYILRNAEVLNKMTIYSDPMCEEKQALHKELLRVPKVSKACVVDFF